MITIDLPRRVYLSLAAFAGLGVLSLIVVYPPDLTIGRMFEADGQLDKATDYYLAWNQEHPSDYRSRWHTAELLLQSADPERAVSALEEMARDWPEDPRILARLVEIEDSLLRVEGVVPRLEALVAISPDDPEVLRRLADHYRWFGEAEKLIGTLQLLVRLGDFPEERIELVEILLSRRRYDDLIAFFSAGIDQMPNRVDARLALYQAYVRTGRTDRAIEQLELILELAPGRIEEMRELADLLVATERLAEAIALYEARIDADPRDQRLRGELVELYDVAADRAAARGKRGAVILLMRRRVNLEPTNVEYRLALADAHGEQSTQVAIVELRELLTLAPNSAAGWAALAERLSWSGKAAEAVSGFRRAVELAPSDIGMRRALAQHLLWGEQNDAALAEFRTLVEKGGTLDDRALLVELLLDGNNGAAALRHASELRRRKVSAPRYRRLFAFAAALAGECELALPELRWVTQQNAEDTDAWYSLGQCATKLDRPDEALQALRHTQRLRGRDRMRRRGESE